MVLSNGHGFSWFVHEKQFCFTDCLIDDLSYWHAEVLHDFCKDFLICHVITGCQSSAFYADVVHIERVANCVTSFSLTSVHWICVNFTSKSPCHAQHILPPYYIQSHIIPLDALSQRVSHNPLTLLLGDTKSKSASTRIFYTNADHLDGYYSYTLFQNQKVLITHCKYQR